MDIKQRILKFINVAGLTAFEPVVRLCFGDDPRDQLKKIFFYICVPVFTIFAFLAVWSAISPNIVTRSGTIPTPGEVWKEAGNLKTAHYEERNRQSEFYQQQRVMAGQLLAEAKLLKASSEATSDPAEASRLKAAASQKAQLALKSRERKYSGSPTFLDNILISLLTMFTGFFIASLIAIPLGILCGLSKSFNAAVNPFIQIFKPVSPLAWLPIVMIVVGGLYTLNPKDSIFFPEKAFISSAITVALCSLWPTLVNTAVGVASIDKDHLNVAKVLQLGPVARLFKIILPASLPLMFTGLRISLGVGWMVLVAADMLAQNPGLGKFVWDMFQNGSSQTLAQIMVAVFVIGFIGLLLDRVMLVLQKMVTFDSMATA
jgi:nitrate/nitrite transport system permease protein